MTDRATLLALADRVEAAEGPDFGLDADIARAAGYVQHFDSLWWSPAIVRAARKSRRGKWHHGRAAMLPAFITSIDAALTLVPKGWKWALYSADDRSNPVAYCVPNMGRLPWPEWVTDIEAATPALALCAAALRALAQEAPGDE